MLNVTSKLYEPHTFLRKIVTGTNIYNNWGIQKSQGFSNGSTPFYRGAYHSKKISYTFCENPIFYQKIPRNPFVLDNILYAICKSESPLALYKKIPSIYAQLHQKYNNCDIEGCKCAVLFKSDFISWCTLLCL